MANLIIKSSADDLVLKGSGQSGSDVAITIGATGTTTFAEAATMSGNVTMSGTANNLGTISSATTFPAGHVKNTWYKGSSRSSGLDIANTNAYQDCSCAADISVTSGNLLFLHWSGGVMASSAKHWSFNMYVDGDSTGNTAWGTGIYHGTTTISGWMPFSGQSIHVLDTTGTVTVELKANCNVGTITITSDGNVATEGGQAGSTDNGFGYDGIHWIAQEIQV